MGTYGPGDEDEDVTFDDLVDDYDDEDEAIDAVSQTMDDVVNWFLNFQQRFSKNHGSHLKWSIPTLGSLVPKLGVRRCSLSLSSSFVCFSCYSPIVSVCESGTDISHSRDCFTFTNFSYCPLIRLCEQSGVSSPLCRGLTNSHLC